MNSNEKPIMEDLFVMAELGEVGPGPPNLKNFPFIYGKKIYRCLYYLSPPPVPSTFQPKRLRSSVVVHMFLPFPRSWERVQWEYSFGLLFFLKEKSQIFPSFSIKASSFSRFTFSRSPHRRPFIFLIPWFPLAVCSDSNESSPRALHNDNIEPSEQRCISQSQLPANIVTSIVPRPPRNHDKRTARCQRSPTVLQVPTSVCVCLLWLVFNCLF